MSLCSIHFFVKQLAPLSACVSPGVCFVPPFLYNERLVRLHQYHDAHTVHKVLSKLQPIEEETFLATYNEQVGWSRQPATESRSVAVK